MLRASRLGACTGGDFEDKFERTGDWREAVPGAVRRVENPFWSPTYRAVREDQPKLEAGYYRSTVVGRHRAGRYRTGRRYCSGPARRQFLGSTSVVPRPTLAGDRCGLGHEYLPHLVLGPRRRDG